MNRTVARALASSIVASNACHKSGNLLWRNRWGEYIEYIMKSAPRGSGFDSGTKLVEEDCSSKVLVFTTSFHHMDEHGSYDGWTDHTIYVLPDFVLGVDITVSGKNRNNIKDYIAETFLLWLNEPAPAHPGSKDNANHSQV